MIPSKRHSLRSDVLYLQAGPSMHREVASPPWARNVHPVDWRVSWRKAKQLVKLHSSQGPTRTRREVAVERTSSREQASTSHEEGGDGATHEEAPPEAAGSEASHEVTHSPRGADLCTPAVEPPCRLILIEQRDLPSGH